MGEMWPRVKWNKRDKSLYWADCPKPQSHKIFSWLYPSNLTTAWSDRSSGSGIAEKKSSSVAEKGDRVVEKNREKIFKFEIYLKRCHFGSPRTGPDPTHTKTIPEIFFFWPKMGTPGIHMQRYPNGIRTHDVPSTGTAPIFPYRCFLAYG